VVRPQETKKQAIYDSLSITIFASAEMKAGSVFRDSVLLYSRIPDDMASSL